MTSGIRITNSRTERCATIQLRAIGFAAILVLAELLENPLTVYPRNKTK
ncbi:hypothetical protein [[Eubacterium] cellulosolvens]